METRAEFSEGHDHTPDPDDPESCLHACWACVDEFTGPEVRDWYFTFGYGQRLQAMRARRNDDDDGGGEGLGISLNDCYVKIHGDFNSARMRMYELFGTVWCDQYAKLPPEFKWIDLSILIGLTGSSQSG